MRAARRLSPRKLTAALVAWVLASAAEALAPRRVPALPARLADTGLYSDFAARTISARNLPYSPQYPLWSDGARKSRWVYLPPGTSIDASRPDAWRFPVGTKFWKEFAWSRRVETRYLERTRAGWRYATYVWDEHETDAVLAPEAGALSRQELSPGRRHAIPAVADCRNCHQGGRSEVLGFGVLQLSSDRDPLAPHAEPLRPGMPTLDSLVRGGFLRGLPGHLVARPPRIAAETPRGRAVLGYLHANCSICHDSVGPLASLQLDLRHALGARVQGEEPASRAIGHASRAQLPLEASPSGAAAWIAPGQGNSSAVLLRMASRNPMVQMPPLGSQLVDDEAVALVKGWIEEDLAPARRSGALGEP